jgi:hypothetical protein
MFRRQLLLPSSGKSKNSTMCGKNSGIYMEGKEWVVDWHWHLGRIYCLQFSIFCVGKKIKFNLKQAMKTQRGRYNQAWTISKSYPWEGMYSHLRSNNSPSLNLTAIISVIIMVAVICTGYKFNNRKLILIPIQKRIKHLFTSHRSLRVRKKSMLQQKYTTIDTSNTWFVQLFVVNV